MRKVGKVNLWRTEGEEKERKFLSTLQQVAVVSRFFLSRPPEEDLKVAVMSCG